MKPYHRIPILECGEPLVPIPDRDDLFVKIAPHPYQQLGADYGTSSPFMLRSGVVEALIRSAELLRANYPDWRILIFDAYRPIAVQQFMVDYTFAELRQARKASAQITDLQAEVYKFWAIPSPDPRTPPPHSTGSAIDITLLTPDRIAVDMGSPIDEISDRSQPDYFTTIAPEIHHHRQILASIMSSAGWAQHPHEWWHFSYGDQMWAWRTGATTARYGGFQYP